MLPLEEVLSTDTQTFSFTFTGVGIGYAIGAVICGGCIPHVNQEVLFVFSTVLTASTTAAAPFTGHVGGFIALITVQSAAMGCIDTGANVYGLTLWNDERLQRPLMLGMYCVWCIGATVGPLIAQQFIPPNHTNNTQELLTVTSSSSTSMAYYGVEFAYVTIAVLVAFTSAPFALVYIASRLPYKRQTEEIRTTEPVDEKENFTMTKLTRRVLLALIFILAALYVSLECTTSNFISAFAVKHLAWDAVDAAAISSVFWAGLGVGRFINIFISLILIPESMLYINLCLITCSFIILLFVDYSRVCLWIGVAVAGYGMASMFVSIVLWASERMRITGAASAVLIVAGSVGCTAAAPTVGLLFDQFTPMSLVYVNLCISVLLLLLFFLVSLFAKLKLKPKQMMVSV